MRNTVSPKTYYLAGAFFAGIYAFIDSMVDIIAKKSLHASPLIVTFLTMLPSMTLLFSVFLTNLAEKCPKQKLLLRIVAFIGRFSFVIFLFYISIPVYLIILTLCFTAFTLFNPMLNNFLKDTFSPRERGRFVGIAMSITAATAVVYSRCAGKLLDIRPSLTAAILAAGGVAGFLYFYITSIPFKDHPVDRTKKTTLNPFATMIRVFKKDPVFFRFETYFFVYGIAFMIILPAIPIYLVDILKLNYSVISSAKVLIPQLFVIGLAPFVGKLHDKTTPQRFSGLSFLLLSSFPLLLGLASFFPQQGAIILLLSAYVMYGISMIGVSFAWNISTIELAKHGTPQQYQSIHITLTGIRGLIIPPLGYFLLKMRFLPINAIFFISSALFLYSSYLMFRDARRLKALENHTDSAILAPATQKEE